MLAGEPDTPPWTKLSDDGERATFYAGAPTIELYRTETGNYRDNLAVERAAAVGGAAPDRRRAALHAARASPPIRPRAKA